MKFNQIVTEYLTGNQLSNGLSVDIAPYKQKNIDRILLFENLVQGKKIIHLGCCDHLSLIDTKIKNNTWLHARLCQSANRCLGVDINKEGVEYLQNILHYQDVIFLDITNSGTNILHSAKWDYLIMGEILEHVDNPCNFLKAIKRNYSGTISKIIISVPNALSLQNIKYSFFNKEFINTDHRYWFTPYTLAKIVTLSGMKVEEFWFCQPVQSEYLGLSYKLHLKSFFLDLIFQKRPVFQQTLVMVVEID